MKEMGLEEFVRLLKSTADSKGQLAFFLGAGCSISSKIPGAAELVREWIPKLHHRMTGGKVPLEEWVPTALKDYDEKNAAASYAEVMRRLFPQAPLRRAEVDRFVRGRDPAFGYAVLARLVTHPVYGMNFNLVLTTNFDDLVADALYLYTQQKPLVIAHESLSGFAETGLTRPLVIKLHGDALLEPKSLADETRELDPEIEKVLTEQLRRRGLVFVGYGGNDRGITAFLGRLPENALDWGLYWVNETVPDNEFGQWVKSRPNAYWIRHLSFDELMVLVFQEFGLEHPERRRFERLMVTYRETFVELTKGVESRAEDQVKQVLSSALKKTAGEFRDWWAVELAARDHKKTDSEEADRIYREGLEKFPKSPELLYNYALFLQDVRKEMDKAEACYRRALEAAPTDADILCNYALFQQLVRNEMDEAEAYYERSLEAAPADALIHSNYALFLQDVRKEMDKAEAHYKRALEAAPTDADILGNYAVFLRDVRKDMDSAETLYKRALESGRNEADILGSYGDFLWTVREDVDGAEAYYKLALESCPTDANVLGNYSQLLLAAGRNDEGMKMLAEALISSEQSKQHDLLLECQFYRLAHAPEDEGKDALREVKKLLQQGVRSPGWDLTPNIERAAATGHPRVPLLRALARVITEGAELESLAESLE